jgi:hypothetical protein
VLKMCTPPLQVSQPLLASYLSSEQRRLLQEMVVADVSAEQLLSDFAVMEQMGAGKLVGRQGQQPLYAVENLVPLLEER